MESGRKSGKGRSERVVKNLRIRERGLQWEIYRVSEKSGWREGGSKGENCGIGGIEGVWEEGRERGGRVEGGKKGVYEEGNERAGI